MPDGDRFERTLYGKGWRKAYRLACSDQPYDLIADRLNKAAAAALRGPFACTSLLRMRDAILQALRDNGEKPSLLDQGNTDSYSRLSELLEDIAAEHSNSASSRLASQKAKEVYLELTSQQSPSSSLMLGQEVETRLARAFGWGIVRNQWLAKVREGIMKKSKRTVDEQVRWEEGLASHLADGLGSMVGQLFQTDRKSAIRAPRGTTPKRRMTIEELHQGIAVLEVDHV
jgi:hypothetical protein